ncbi:MAG: zinc-ribbon domain-containing protein [Desulfatiglans sp.]|jgi:CheY-like chemotaxis protein|nr:zinc-ribbon domain-containing protein [Thermodesulfobacteriota bacterium]MEE4351883.1 zinc-ribbon domain-containing protein [Desulfatiglans sp.]
MKITCDSCKTILNVPDEKVPENQPLVFACPKCKDRVTLYPKDPLAEKSSPAQDENRQKSLHGVDTDDLDEDDAIDFFEEGVKLALVLNTDLEQTKVLRQAVEDLEYTYVPAQDTREAIGMMRLHHFDLVILSEGYDGIKTSQSPILQYLNNISIPERRRIFLALIGDSFKTMDHLKAFSVSANFVMNWKDADTITSILKRAVLENDRFYKVFLDTLEEVRGG